MNLRLSGETYTDRARIVINPSAQPGYDMNNDAVKWMSSNKEIPQFYTLGGEGKRYAINERPLGTGSVPVGLYVGQTGIYTFEKWRMRFGSRSVCLTNMKTNRLICAVIPIRSMQIKGLWTIDLKSVLASRPLIFR